MGIRFKKVIKILPGLWLNINKGGVSVSSGIRGLKFTSGKEKSISVGIPGTGLFWRKIFKKVK
ncbi:MAG: DUF4236 domain-containing protein [candidate division WOR-3 bacterium]